MSKRRAPQPEALIDDLSDESEDERRDFSRPGRNLFESRHGPEMGGDGDDNPEYAQPKEPAFTTSGKSVKAKLKNGETAKVEVIEPGQIHETIVIRPRVNPAGEIVDAGHGFIVNDPRSRSWKTAPRTHCAHCGGPMPPPDVSKYRCEFDPAATATELALIGAVPSQPDRLAALIGNDRAEASRPGHPGCQCSGCSLRWLVLNRHERNRGNPRKVCSDECGRQRDNERNRWKRAVKKAEDAGLTAPDEPEDKGHKLMLRHGPRSGSEGNGKRYTAATDTRLWPGAPRT